MKRVIFILNGGEYINIPADRMEVTETEIRAWNGNDLVAYGYTFCDRYTYPTMTNADRIRAMSDEELSAFLCDFRTCDANNHPCNGCKAEQYCRVGHTGMIDWIQQPAEPQKEDA